MKCLKKMHDSRPCSTSCSLTRENQGLHKDTLLVIQIYHDRTRDQTLNALTIVIMMGRVVSFTQKRHKSMPETRRTPSRKLVRDAFERVSSSRLKVSSRARLTLAQYEDLIRNVVHVEPSNIKLRRSWDVNKKSLDSQVRVILKAALRLPNSSRLSIGSLFVNQYKVELASSYAPACK